VQNPQNDQLWRAGRHLGRIMDPFQRLTTLPQPNRRVVACGMLVVFRTSCCPKK
jgi:hypothetical protein